MIKKIFDILFPQTRSTYRVNSLTPSTLYERAEKTSKSPHHWITSIFNYQDSLVRNVIWELKYKKNTHVANMCATILSDHLSEYIAELELFSGKQVIVVPIPSSQHRIKTKGFSQTDLLCACFSLPIPIKKVLKRNHQHTLQSHVKNRMERIKNVQDCFTCTNPQSVVNTNIILIDDVTTTGATLEEARKTLLKAGAKNVHAFTIAH